MLLDRADRFDVAVIENRSLDAAIGEIMDLVLNEAERLVKAS
jgi:2-phosphoglycerate kinase